MSASAQMKAMLDQLMGTGRNQPDSKSKAFENAGVCRTFLLGCCPHDILTGTRADIGECKKTHDLALKADFEMTPNNESYFYDFDAFDHLNAFIVDTDRRIESSKVRLAEQQAEVSADVKAKQNAVHDLNEEIGKLLVKAEEAGCAGNVDEAKQLMEEVEATKEKKREAEEIYRNAMPPSTYQQQKLRVCEICSAYLGLHDNDCRLADHFGGKLHAGFITLREKHEKLKTSVESRRELYEKEKESKRMERLRSPPRIKREYDRGDGPSRSRSRDRTNGYDRRRRSRSRDRRSRSRDRYRRRSRERRRSRSRSRDRRRRSRSRSRERRSSRDRSSRYRRRSRSRS